MGEIADALIDKMLDFDIDYDWFDETDASPPPGYAQPGKIAAPTDFPDCSIVPRSVVLELI